jgi:DNA-binding IclR family transcriptional regulator
MARSAPAVDRTVALMTFLAHHRGEAFSLSELSRQLEINKATVHGMVAALVEAGWVWRDPVRMRIRLGPGLIAIANAAISTYQDAVDAGQGELRQLAEKLRTPCSASAVIGDEVVLVAIEGPPPPFGVAGEVGHRVQLAPPLGAAFVAWSDDETRERWLASAEPGSDEELLELYRRALAVVRERGFEFTRQVYSRQRLSQALLSLTKGMPSRQARLAVGQLLEELKQEENDRSVLDIQADEIYEDGFLGAPVFDGSGQVIIVISLIGFGTPLTGTQVLERAGYLLETASAITRNINGSPPSFSAF